jgi:hypothetical protein
MILELCEIWSGTLGGACGQKNCGGRFRARGNNNDLLMSIFLLPTFHVGLARPTDHLPLPEEAKSVYAYIYQTERRNRGVRNACHEITRKTWTLQRSMRRPGNQNNGFAARHHRASTHRVFWPIGLLHPPWSHGLPLYWRGHYRRYRCFRMALLR